MKNFFIKEEFSFFVLLYTFIKKDTILTLIYIVMKISHIEHLGIAVKSIEGVSVHFRTVGMSVSGRYQENNRSLSKV